MEKRNRNVMVLSIVALVLVLVGVTYAYFSAQITGIESASTISLTAGRMGIHYSEGDENVTVSNIYPKDEAWVTKTFTLTGYNTTDQEMKYELGLNITNNTFKGGQLTFDLTGVGTNGTKIADITGKSITKISGFFKFGTGVFLESDGDTHVYTLKIYFKDNGKDQNINQGAIFNAKVDVREYVSNVATVNQNHNGKHCYTDDYVEGVTPTNGTEYVNGQYTYKYNYRASGKTSWSSSTSQKGWGVMLTDKDSTNPVTTELCAYVNEKPVVNMANMFCQSKATSIDLTSFDTSNVINMNRMFSYSQATSLDLSSFDTSSVTNMAGMFYQSHITSLDLKSFDTSNVTSMAQMFYYNSILNLDISSFDTSKVTNMSNMFYNSYVNDLDTSSFDTSNVENMSYMFYQTAATTLDLSNFDTSSVTNMSYMFDGSRATSVDLSSFNTSKVTDMSNMFYYSWVNNLDLTSFDTSNVTKMSSMFYRIQSVSIDLSSFDTSNVTDMSGMFYNCPNLTTIYASNKFVTTSLAADSSSFPYAGSYQMFDSSTNLVGGAGTIYDASKTNKAYAHIDGGTSNPGYFTDIKDKPNS